MSRNGILRLCVAAALLPGAGCVTLESLTPGPGGIVRERPPEGPVNRIEMVWGTKIDGIPDSNRGGALVPGLSGNVYLFGPQSAKPVRGNGSLKFDLTYTGADGQPRTFDVKYPKDCVYMTKDSLMEWGYRVFLPWPDYQPWIKQVKIQVSFVPEQGPPVYSSPHTFTLHQEGIQSHTTQIPIMEANPVPLPEQRALANPIR